MKQSEAQNILAKTSRLILRPLDKQDADAVFHYRNQPQVKLFQGWTPASPDEVIAYAGEMANRPVAAPGYWYQVVIQLDSENSTDHSVIGDIAFCIDQETQQQAELGISLDVCYHHQGYALESVAALLKYLFVTRQLHRVHVSIDPDNKASLQLFERAGFRLEGHMKKSVWFKDQWCDDIVMAVLQEEWSPVKITV